MLYDKKKIEFKEIHVKPKSQVYALVILKPKQFQVRPSSLLNTQVWIFLLKGSISGLVSEGRIIPLWAGQQFTRKLAQDYLKRILPLNHITQLWNILLQFLCVSCL